MSSENKIVYLLPQHQNFQVGKTTLHRPIDLETNFLGLFVSFIIPIVVIILCSFPHWMEWRYQQYGTVVSAVVLSCDESRVSKGGYSTYLYYTYNVNGVSYTGDSRYSNGRYCYPFPQGTDIEVVYLADEPQVSRLPFEVTYSGDGSYSRYSSSASIVGIAILIQIIMSLLIVALIIALRRHLKSEQKFRLLKQSNTLLEGKLQYLDTESFGSRGSITSAVYLFKSPESNSIVFGQARILPWQVKPGDTLQILYLDDETHCAL